MRKISILLLLMILSVSCKYFRGDECNNTKPIVGTYENKYDKEANNVLIIKEGGTFEQIFIKGDVTEKNNGTWKLSTELCEIYLSNLKVMHELPKLAQKYHTDTGVYRLDNIVFVEGMSYEFNFYRVND